MAWRDPRGGSQPPASREGAGADRNCAAEPGGSGAFRAAEGGAANEGRQQDGPGPVDRRDHAGPRGHAGDERPCLARRHHTRTQRRELGLGRRAFLLARLRMRVGLTPRLPGTPRSRGCRRFRVSCAVIRTPDCQGEARSLAAALHALLTLVNRFGHQQSTHGKVFVQLRPVDSDTAANQTPISQGLGAGIAQLREPLERHANSPAVLKIDDEIAFEDLYAKGSGMLRCRNTR